MVSLMEEVLVERGLGQRPKEFMIDGAASPSSLLVVSLHG